MKKLMMVAVGAGLFSACECYDEDLYRSAYERPREFCWENYDERDYSCDSRRRHRYSTYPVHIETAYIRVYKGPVTYQNYSRSAGNCR